MPPKSNKPSSSTHQNQPLNQQPTTKASYAMVPIKPTNLPSSTQPTTSTTIPRIRPLNPTDWYLQVVEEETQQQQLLNQVTDKSFAQTVTTKSSKEVAPCPSSATMAAIGPIVSSSKNVAVSVNPTPISQISPFTASRSPYLYKPPSYIITELQQEYQNPFANQTNYESIQNFLQTIFISDNHFITSTPIKTRTFYEFILVDTDSVSIKHYPDKFDQSQIAYSTCQIHKILTIDDWKNHPNQTHSFSQHFVPSNYNYYDYQKAWYNTLYQQNKTFRHSWMFYFSNKFHQTLPAWFINWWNMFGPIPDILPKEAHQGFQIYQENFKIPTSYPMNKFPHLFYFFQQFSLAWIVQWEYDHQAPTISSLVRNIKVKWWDQFKIDRVTPPAIDKFFHQNPTLSSSTSTQFLLHKSQNLSKLAATSSKAELKKQLLAALESLSEHESSGDSNSTAGSFSSVNLGNDNEDDCYGILPPIKQETPPAPIKQKKKSTKSRK